PVSHDSGWLEHVALYAAKSGCHSALWLSHDNYQCRFLYPVRSARNNGSQTDTNIEYVSSDPAHRPRPVTGHHRYWYHDLLHPSKLTTDWWHDAEFAKSRSLPP